MSGGVTKPITNNNKLYTHFLISNNFMWKPSNNIIVVPKLKYPIWVKKPIKSTSLILQIKWSLIKPVKKKTANGNKYFTYNVKITTKSKPNRLTVLIISTFSCKYNPGIIKHKHE